MSPIFHVEKPSSQTPEENLKSLSGVCHVVELKGSFALVHASPTGLLKISELGLEVFPAKRGPEYYAVKIGQLSPERIEVKPEPVPAPRMGSFLSIRGQDYRVLETRPKRRQDLRRFEVRKASNHEVFYVVSFQEKGAACSCADWIYRRRQCKHIQSIREAIWYSSQKISP